MDKIRRRAEDGSASSGTELNLSSNLRQTTPKVTIPTAVLEGTVPLNQRNIHHNMGLRAPVRNETEMTKTDELRTLLPTTRSNADLFGRAATRR